jgi:hypothetical protein
VRKKNMNRKARARAVALCLALFTVIYGLGGKAPVFSALVDSATISSSGQIIMAPNINVNFYACSYSFSEYTNASIIGATYGLSQSWYAPQDANYAVRIEQAKAANPNYKALIYRDIAHVYSYWTDEWNTAQANGWLLKDASGNYVLDSGYSTNYYVDIGNPAYQQWVAQKIESWLTSYPYFDGVFADDGLAVNTAWEYYATSTPINPRTGSPWTNNEIENAYVGLENAIKAAIGNKVLVCNGLWSGDDFSYWQASFLDLLSRSSLDGAMAEGCWYQNGGQWETLTQWQESLNFTAQLQSYFGSKPNGAFVQCDFSNDGVPSGATPSQLLLYGYCSSLLTSQNNKNYLGVMAETSSPDTTLISLMQTLNAVSFGSSVSSYYQVSGTGLYVRDFQNAKVIVNPSSSTYNIQLSSQYYTLDGSAVSGSYSIAPYTGVVLLKG